MKRKIFILAFLCLYLLSVDAKAKHPALIESPGLGFLSFTENKGQIRDQYDQPRIDIDFSLHQNALNLFISAGHIYYQFNRLNNKDELQSSLRNQTQPSGIPLEQTVAPDYTLYRLEMELAGSNISAKPIVENIIQQKLNYYRPALGSDGITNVQSCKKIIYPDIYPNIDWVIYIKDGKLKYDFVLHEGADPADIRIRYQGAKSMQLQPDGGILIRTPLGTVTEDKPLAYTADNGTAVPSRFLQKGMDWGFAIGPFSGTLILDPGLSWATYYGGSELEFTQGVYAKGGNVYMVGGSTSISQIATTGTYQTNFGGGAYPDAYLAKFNSDGSLQWASYYGGGTATDMGWSVVADDVGGVYMAGYSSEATGIATPGSHQPLYGGGMTDGFLVKFNNAGQRIWATYYGGADYDYAQRLAIDGAFIYMSGTTYSASGIASSGSYQSTYTVSNNNYGNAFLVKWDTAGQRHWATYFGTGITSSSDVVVDQNHKIYLSGRTSASSGMSTPGSHQVTIGGFADNFLAQFDASGQRVWCSYFGGNGAEGAYPVMTIDAQNHVYLSGVTFSSNNIASPGASRTVYSNSVDGYLTCFNDLGTRLWGTYIGPDYPYGGFYVSGLTTGHCGNSVYITGDVYPSVNIMPTADAYRNVPPGGSFDWALLRYTTDGSMDYSSYLGGTNTDNVMGISMSEEGSLYLAGITESDTGIATSESYQPVFSGGQDACLLKMLDVFIVTDDPKVPFDTAICSNSFLLPYVVSAPFYGDNIFVAEISDSNGNFSSPIIIGSTTSAVSGAISCLIPASLSPGSGYRIRVSSSSPLCFSSCPINVVLSMPPVPSITVHQDTLISSIAPNYQWVFNGNNISGATAQQYIANASGIYQVKVIDPLTGCSSLSDSINIGGVGIFPVTENQLNIRIYPNPFEQQLMVIVDPARSEVSKYSITLTDVFGRTVYLQSNLKYKNKLELTVLRAGTYFLRIVGPEGRLTYKVVKQL
jgi:hypothetical protein